MSKDRKQIIKKIQELEKQSISLDPDVDERKELMANVSEFAENFLTSLNNRPVFKNCENEGSKLLNSPFSDESEPLGNILKSFTDNVLESGLNPASPGHFGYIPGSGLYYSALGDYLAAVTNRYSGIYAASPGAVRMEAMVIQWFAKEIGYPESSSGDLTSGGSIANLSAVVAARDAFGFKAKEYSKLVVYLTAHTHHCIEKSIRIAGLGETVIRVVPVDANFKMQPESFVQMVKHDKSLGLIPWLIVASAGTTDVGSIDPLVDLFEIAKINKMWFHVDGAYGASFVLCKSGKKNLKGIEDADTLTMDPHKGLFAPFGTGVILAKNGMDLHRPYQYEANYMQDEKTLAKKDQMSPAELSPELTRHFRGLRIWMALKIAGISAFRSALEEKMLLAQYFYNELQSIDRIETGPFPDLSIVIFRYVPQEGNPNTFNQVLLEKIIKEGSVFMSSTMINNNFMIRMAILSFRSHLEKVDQAITIIRSMIQRIEN